jgi:hypothetical protein
MVLMTFLVALLLVVGCPIGLCAVICCAGWWATVKPRLEHQRQMFALNETAKANAVTVDERRLAMLNTPRSEYVATP